MDELSPEIAGRVNTWLDGEFDDDTKRQIRSLIDSKDWKELTDAFYRDLEFGTGGLRGIMGAGTNRINRYTLAMATQGLSNYLRRIYPSEQVRVAIAHDNRNNASAFARVVAEVFAANDIHVYFFDGMRPTPELSFAIRELGCHSGVMLTASHNPKEYSGYKAYWRDGGQVTPPHDRRIIEEVDKVHGISDVRFDADEGLIKMIGDEMDRKYIAKLTEVSVSPEAIKRQSDMRIVFSPIHGAGIAGVPQVLEAFGFNNVTLVEEQCVPDGNFPTVIYPNPEEHEALTLSIEKAREVDGELIMATDPDVDRVGIAVKDDRGEYILLNGNETGCLLINYLLERWDDLGKLTGNEYIVKTIVTSYLMDRIAEARGVECYNVLTGFKYIGALMTDLEDEKTFIAGGEESYGYLVGDHARDKDAVVACASIAEMAAYYRDQGRSLYEAMVDMYAEYGFYREKLVSLTKKGKEGSEEIAAMMERLRKQPPAELGGSVVARVLDYEARIEVDARTGDAKAIELPRSNVLQLVMEDGSIVSARPSGTEPKIKFYCSTTGTLGKDRDYRGMSAKLDARIDSMLGDLGVM